MNGWKPRKAAWATCGSVRGIVIVVEVEGEEASGVEADAEGCVFPVAAIFFNRSRSFSDKYSKTERVAVDCASPSMKPRCFTHKSLLREGIRERIYLICSDTRPPPFFMWEGSTLRWWFRLLHVFLVRIHISIPDTLWIWSPALRNVR